MPKNFLRITALLQLLDINTCMEVPKTKLE